jgi:hypothetical protein
MWENIINTLLKGSFGFIIFRSLVDGIRRTFTSRSREVQIAKLLRSDMLATEGRVQSFVCAVNDIIQKNQAVTNGQYNCDSISLPPVDSTYRQSYAEVYSVFQKYDSNSIQDLTTFFVVAHNYEVLLTAYRQLYLGTGAIKYRADPNLKYQQLSTSMGLAAIGTHARPVYAAIDKIIEGRKVWKFMKKRFLYRSLAVFCGILLIFIPEREAL